MSADCAYVLVVDDDPDTRANLCDILELDNHRVETAGSIAEALQRKDWSQISAILLDRKLPDGTAEEVLPRLKELAPQADILVVTGHADIQGAVEALRQGAADYILKPINAEAIRGSLFRLAQRQALAREKTRSEAAFRTLIEAAPCMILIVSPDHAILYFSRYAEDLTDYAASDVLGKDCFQTFVPTSHQKAAAEEVERVFAGIPSRGYEFPVVGRDRTPHWMVWNIERLEEYQGSPAVLAVGQDITKLKEAQEHALQSERLAAIGQMVAGLAHESGNALARSQACLEMLTWEVGDRPEALDLIARTQKAQEHLQQLYEEVRGYAAPLKLAREVWDLGYLWRQAWEHLALQRQNKQAALQENTAGADLNAWVDHFRLEQVFRNIFENALAACGNSVVITVTVSATTLAGQPALRVAVRDSGPGLDQEQRHRIFEPFFTTKTKGTGLGMAIVKRIIEAHGGTIEVGSPAGPGAEIIITLPRQGAAA
jgi:PAS domain S-box-containing protein